MEAHSQNFTMNSLLSMNPLLDQDNSSANPVLTAEGDTRRSTTHLFPGFISFILNYSIVSVQNQVNMALYSKVGVELRSFPNLMIL